MITIMVIIMRVFVDYGKGDNHEGGDDRDHEECAHHYDDDDDDGHYGRIATTVMITKDGGNDYHEDGCRGDGGNGTLQANNELGHSVPHPQL